MTDAERLARMRHDLANPLAALLAEIQLLILEPAGVSPEVLGKLRELEQLAIRLRTILRQA